MPLPPPACAREASHQRSITITAYARSDGLWDIEGHLTDAWTQPVPRAGGLLPPGEPMHSMRLRLTVDSSATVVAAHAITEAGPYEPPAAPSPPTTASWSACAWRAAGATPSAACSDARPAART